MNLAHWLHGRCFSLVHGHQLIYNQCWEDPRLDRQAMRIKPHDVLLVITSAGCNVLDYLLDEPAHIHAVDLNLRQNALLELKIAGIRRLVFEEFFAMFGERRLDDAAGVYRSTLRGDLSEPARAFWDRHIGCFQGSLGRDSFYFHGTTGVFAWLMNLYIDYVARAREIIIALLGASTVQEQSRIYNSELQPVLWKKPMRWAVRRDATLSLLGVPRPQRQQLERDYLGGIGQFMEDSVRAVFGALSLKDNYFWRVYLTGRYTRTCCPNYLKRDNFERLKSGLIDRISIHTTSVAGLLEREKLSISLYVLLDHMDWLSAGDGASLAHEWQAIVNRAAPDARLLWRSAGNRTDYIDRVAVTIGGRSRRVGELLSYHREEAERLHAVDRVHTYGSFSIADLANC